MRLLFVLPPQPVTRQEIDRALRTISYLHPPPDINSGDARITLGGGGWYGVETVGQDRFRWVDNNAAFRLGSLGPADTGLELDVEPGPGLAGSPLQLSVVSERGQIFHTLRPVCGRERLSCPLPALESGAVRDLVLHCEGGGAVIRGDSRKMNFRVFSLSIDGDPPLASRPVSLTIAAGSANVSAYSQLISEEPVVPFNNSAAAEFDAVVMMCNADGEAEELTIPSLPVRIYSVNQFGKLEFFYPEVSEIEVPHLRSHVFQVVGPQTADDSLVYFPYGYSFRSFGRGPTDAFGYRITQDLEGLRRRLSSHILIAVFGGSAAWGYYCQHEEMLSFRLEQELRAQAGRDVTVINFALPYHVTLNEMTTYLIFAESLRPDVVIHHGGSNDFALGAVSDPYLLNEYAIIYPFRMEEWGRRLHSRPEELLTWTDDELRLEARNTQSAVVEAYISRQKQFERLAEGMGAIYISSLQPTINSKKKLSPREKKWLRSVPSTRLRSYQAADLLSAYYLKTNPGTSLKHFVDCYSRLASYGEEQTLFWDFVHPTPGCDSILARYLAGYILEKNLCGLSIGKTAN